MLLARTGSGSMWCVICVQPVSALVWSHDVNADMWKAMRVHLTHTHNSSSVSQQTVPNSEYTLKQYLKCVVDGHCDFACEPMLSTGVVESQVHGRNNNAESAGSKSFVFVR